MNPGTDIVKELEEMDSPLAAMPRVTPFFVPEGYFDTLAKTITEQTLFEENEPTLNLPKEHPFTLPQGYFEGLTASIMVRVAEEPAFGAIAPAAFEVPEGYFASLPNQMLAAAKATDAAETVQTPAEKRAKVISFMPRRMVQWAAAASVILAIGLGGYKVINQGGSTTHLSAEHQLAQLDKGIISSYVQQHLDDFDTEMLAENSPVLTSSPEKNIDQLNKEDIKQYLDAEGI